MILLLMAGTSWCAGVSPRFNTERDDGRNYVRLQDFIKFYGFNPKYTRNSKTIVLRKKYATLQIKVDGQEAIMRRENEDVRLHLSFPPIEDDDMILISEIDVIKTLDPVLRPWSVPEFKIRTIMIDPGHGGFDQGTLGVSRGVMEKTYALDTALRLERYLKMAGYKTLLTRREDEYVSLEDRADQTNESSADLFVSIHYNSASPDRDPDDIETYCLTPAGAPSTGKSDTSISDFRSNSGNRRDIHNMLLAYCVQYTLKKNLDMNDRGVKRARFVVIKESQKPAILVECGFLSNPAEQNRIRSPAHREKLAQSVCQGILKFIGYVNPKKAASGPVKLRDAT